MLNNQVFNYEGLGDEIVDSYFKNLENTDDKNILEEIIRDVAIRENLNNEEIARIIQYANTKIFLRLFKATDDKTVEFDVAVPGSVISGLGDGGKKIVPKFDDSYYDIDDDVDNDDDAAQDENISLDEIIALARKLRDEKEKSLISMMEMRPQLIKKMANKLFNENDRPAYVIYAAKTVGCPDDIIKEACVKVGFKEPLDTSSFNMLINSYDDDFLLKLAEYDKLNRRCKEIDEKLEKISSISNVLGAGKKIISNPLKTLNVVNEISNVGPRTKGYKNEIMNREFKPNRFQKKEMA